MQEPEPAWETGEQGVCRRATGSTGALACTRMKRAFTGCTGTPSGKQYFSHVFVMDTAVEAGFYPKDLFILLAKNRLVADWQRKNQEHARKFHSYFWVFQKSDRRVEYV